MTATAYLTIDDSPTYDTDQLTDFLVAREVPAVLFCIGSAYTDLHVPCQGMEQLPDPIVRAIDKGFLIGNHTYTHRRSSELSFAEVVSEIEKTEQMIDALYKRAGKARPHKLIRFPHIDRGAGGWVVDYDAAGQHGDTLGELFGKGLNITLDPPSAAQVEKKQKIQEYLKREGFSADLFQGVTFPWYCETEMADAADSLYTFSTSDWMMNPDFAAHRAQWAYQSVDALKGKIDQDPWLFSDSSTNIILAHDHNRMLSVTTALIDHMLARGIKFLPVS
ncbi:MAG TPA: polysaccharide deacetylase family protein [Micavibrio sp.]